MLSHVTPWTAACQAPLSMDFSRQEYWSGLPFPSPTFSHFQKISLVTQGFQSFIKVKYFHVKWNDPSECHGVLGFLLCSPI